MNEMQTPQNKLNNRYWTGFRAIIKGDSFIITRYLWGDDMEIELPNGEKAIIDRHLAEAITT